jgi:hypothetical protein
VAGSPTFRINPETLEFQIYPPSFGGSLGMDFPFDAAGDVQDSSVVFTGYQSGLGIRVRRYNPRTGAITTILTGGTIAPGNACAIGSDEFIGVQTQFALLRINPANPPAYQTFSNPSAQGLTSVCMDTDGHYLVTEDGPATKRVFRVDRTTGAFTTVTDLAPSLPASSFMRGVATTPNQDVYVVDDQGGFRVVHRSAGNAVDELPGLTAFDDLLFVEGPITTDVEPPQVPDAPRVLRLSPGVPNPFVAGTLLRFSLPQAGPVALEVYDLSGRLVRTLARGESGAGEHSLVWDGRDDAGGRVRAGLYFARLGFGGEVRRTKLVLAR